MEFMLQSKGLGPYINGPVTTTTSTSTTRTTMTTTTTVPGTPMKGSDPMHGKDSSSDKDAIHFINDSKARGIIGMYVSTDLQPIIDAHSTAYTAWWAIFDYFNAMAKPNKIVLQVRLFQSKQKATDSLLQYLNSVVRIRDHLRGLNVEIPEFMVCCKVVSSLLPQYNPLAQSLMQTDENIMSLSYLRGQFSLEDSRQKLSASANDKPGNSDALLSDDDTKSQIICNRCGIRGHIAKDCRVSQEKVDKFKANGRGNPTNPRGRGQSRGRGRGRGRGHGNNPRANTNEVDDNPVDNIDLSFVMDCDEGVYSALSRDSHWYLDSGCTSHMTHDSSKVFNRIHHATKVSGAVPSKPVIATEIGSVKLFPYLENQSLCLKLENVIIVPGLRKNLVSVKQICARGGHVEFIGDTAHISKNGKIVMTATLVENNLYRINLRDSKSEIHDAEDEPNTSRDVKESMNKPKKENISSKKSIDIWHERLGHLSESEMKKMLRLNMMEGLDFKLEDHLSFCPVCSIGKQTRQKFIHTDSVRTKEIGDVIHSDVCGPITPLSIGGAKYFLTFIDDYSRKSWIYFLKRKSEVFETFKNFRALFRTQTGKPIKCLRSDGGGEYTSNEFSSWLSRKGITHSITPPHTPQHNGVAERLNRTIMDKARCLLNAQNVDKCFWAEAVNTANFLRNRSPTEKVKEMTPEERFTGKKPIAVNLRIFGSKCLVMDNDYKRKLDDRACPAIFLGYSPEYGAYRVFDLTREVTVFSRDVKFNETPRTILETDGDSRKYFSQFGDPLDVQNDNSENSDNSDNFPDRSVPLNPSSEDFSVESSEDEGVSDPLSRIPPSAQSGKSSDHSSTFPEKERKTPESTPMKPRDIDPKKSSSSPLKKIKAKLEIPKLDISKPRISTRAKNTPVPHWDSSKQLEKSRDQDETHDSAQICQIFDEPQSWTEMESSPQKPLWMKAAKEEYDSLISMKTWELVPRKFGMSVIKNRWVFRIKYDAHGNVERYKARLVAKGFTQKKGIDYEETFSPVVRFETLRLLFAYATANNWSLQQMDVKVAFLNGELDEEIYMEQPEGYVNDPNMVCHLRKSLYGLKQAPRCWNAKFRDFMAKQKFIQSAADPCLFIFRDNSGLVLVALYVDDLVITGNGNLVTWTKSILGKQFDMKDLGDLKYILGILVERDDSGLYLSQSTYIDKILKTFKMEKCKPMHTPALPPSGIQSEPLPVDNSYKQAVGSLLYLSTRTRPDLAFAVGAVARQMHNPTMEDWNSIKRILRYLQATRNYVLKYSVENSEILGYSDASYAPVADDRKSTSGFFFISNGAISWRSKKQPIISLSSMEAEYIALADAAKEGIWLNRLEKEIFPENTPKVILLEDNQSTIKTAKNDIINERSKHIDVRYHFIRENIQADKLEIRYCPTDQMVADALTKPLGRTKLELFVAEMGLVPRSSHQGTH